MSLCLAFRLSFTSFSIAPVDLGMNFLVFPLASNLFVYIDGAHWYIAHLCLFFLYYLLIFLLEKLVRKPITEFFLLLLVLGSSVAVFLPPTTTFLTIIRALFPGLAFIVFGRWVRLFFSRKTPFSGVSANVFFLVIYGVATIVVGWSNYGWIITLVYALLLAIVFLCLFSKISFLEWKPFQTVGFASFFMYALHQEIGFIFLKMFYGQDLYWLGLPTIVLVLFLVSYCFSYLWKVKILPAVYDKLISSPGLAGMENGASSAGDDTPKPRDSKRASLPPRLRLSFISMDKRAFLSTPKR